MSTWMTLGMYTASAAGWAAAVILAVRYQRARAAVVAERRARLVDAKTGLFNDAGWQASAGALAAAPPGGRGVVLALDIDDFKTINDTYGHRAGDLVLAEVGKRIQNFLGHAGVGARTGGDEFAAFLTWPRHIPDLSWLEPELTSLWHLLARPFDVNGSDLAVTVSIGAAPFYGPRDAVEVLDVADRALYAGKHTMPVIAPLQARPLRRRRSDHHRDLSPARPGPAGRALRQRAA